MSHSLRFFCLLVACGFVLVPASANALEASGGLSLGAILAGTKPRFALSPHVALAWRIDSGLLFAVHEMFSVLPATNPHGAGIYSQMSVDLGYGWESVNFSLGPSLALYTMPACKPKVCRRVEGLSPGAHAQANAYFAGPLGLSIWTAVDWLGGDSDILSSGVTAIVVAGPVLRWWAK